MQRAPEATRDTVIYTIPFHGSTLETVIKGEDALLWRRLERISRDSPSVIMVLSNMMKPGNFYHDERFFSWAFQIGLFIPVSNAPGRYSISKIARDFVHAIH